ncbi:hypothetical protein [Rathayibacter rathayi]|uniref:hypothetical protein n=1 Tax=Rathayibacter rathayi TaxID=33887 RepID=UPI000BD5092C|nr:hypothetical protein [Rathayibacter rathayi]TWD68398.1 hypothetical protein FB469_0072 [Rathayibacter rathayi]SOE03869.1 hypothetical protein SAMN06295924_1038 [Rathayibacter rathayi NCPPB 2980 = VKM Ac-1601]
MTAEGQQPDPASGADPRDPGEFTPRTFQPTRKDRLRPLELIGFSAVMSAFVGLVVLLSTRETVVAIISFGVAFIVVLVAIAMFSLTFKPDAAEIADIDEQDAHGA